MDKNNLKAVISILKDYVLHNRVAYKDYLGNGKYNIKKLPADLLPDSLREEMNTIAEDIETAQTTADEIRSYLSIVEKRVDHKADKNGLVCSGIFSQNRMDDTKIGSCSHAEGSKTIAIGEASHAEGYNTAAYGKASHAEGIGCAFKMAISGAKGSTEYTYSNAGTTLLPGMVIATQNVTTTIISVESDTITTAKTLSQNSNLVDYRVVVCIAAKGEASHAEGYNTAAYGKASHAEGSKTIAKGEASHAEGCGTTASGHHSHAEGNTTIASGHYSHTEGCQTTASGLCSHAEGYWTIAASENQHAQGKFNVEDEAEKYAHIVGNGTSDEERSNAHTLDWDGVPWFQGRPQFGGNAQDDGSQTVMANGDKEIILTSSTAGSVKKFKITVDDSGTISATLVE